MRKLLAFLFCLVALPAVAQVVPGTTSGFAYDPFVSQVFTAQAPSSLSPAVTYSRSGASGFVNSSNTWQAVSANQARLDTAWGLLVQGTSTNQIRNNTAAGESAGTPPTNWPAPTLGSGVTATWNAPATDSGLTAASVTLGGSPGATASSFIFFEATNQIPAIQGDLVAFSVYLSLPAGSLANVTSIKLNLTERSSGGGSLASQACPAVTPTNAALGGQRFICTVTMQNASTAFVQPSLLITTAAGTLNATLLMVPQLEKAGAPTSLILTSSAAATRNADIASQSSPLQVNNTGQGKISVSAIAALGSGIQTLIEQDDGTNDNRVYLYRDTTGKLHAVEVVGGVTAADIPLGVIANGVSFSATVSWGGTNFSATLGANTVVSVTASARAASGMTTVRLGTDSTGANPWNGWIVSETLNSLYYAPNAPSWVDDGATLSADFANQRYYNFTPGNLSIARNSTETTYGPTGSLVTYGTNVAVLPAYNPNNSNSALGLGIWQFASNWWANSAAPANQTVTPTVNGTYIAYCLTNSTGSIALSGGVSQTITCGPSASGFFGVAAPTPFTLNGSTSVTATLSGSVSFMQLANIPVTNPQNVTGGTVPNTQATDVIQANIAGTGISPTQGAFVTRFFNSQLIQAGTIFSFTDGTTNNRLAANWKVTPTHQSGVTVVTSGTTIGGVDPATKEVDTVGYHTFAYAYQINGDYSGTIKVALDGSDVVTSNFTAGEMPAGLNSLLMGTDDIGGLGILPMNGHMQRYTYFPSVLSDASIKSLSATVGP